MIDCNRARDLLAPEPGPLPSSPEADAAFAHYEACADCQAFFDGHRQVAARVREAASRIRAPDYLESRIVAALADQTRTSPARRATRNLWFGGLATAAAAVLALWLGPPVGSDPLTARPFVEQALAVDGPARATLARNPAPMAEWFQSQQIHGFSIPDIADAQMFRGRVMYVGGSKSAAVDFETTNGFGVTYIMVPETRLFDGVTDSDIMTMSSDGWEVAMWVENGTARAVLSQMPRPDLVTIAEQCKNKRAL